MRDTQTLAILGGGQLGRMLTLAAIPMGIRVRVLDPAGDSCSAAPIAHVVRGAFHDRQAVEQLIDGLQPGDAVTFEFENVPAATVEMLESAANSRGFAVYPNARSLEVAQDRGREKALFESVGVPVGVYKLVDTKDELLRAWDEIGSTNNGLVVKARAGGYDGKGQAVVRNSDALQSAWDALAEAAHKVGLIAEALVPFTRERSVIVARSADGSSRTYPCAVNVHTHGILTRSTPSAITNTQARDAAVAIGDHLEHVGVLAVEFFELEDGTVLANELAPRVHNSCHWSIEACQCSQFENHVRAVMGFQLGETSLVRPATMLNLIGTLLPIKQCAAVPGAHMHVYGKEERADRKVGHITVTAEHGDAVEAAASRIEQMIDAACMHQEAKIEHTT